jgi:hypothetical protein
MATKAGAVVLVEGPSDQRAVETLAGRLGRDLRAEGVAVVPMGGYGNIDRFLERYGPRGLGARLAGLYDAGEERHFRRALEQAGLGADLEAAGFFRCEADLEEELTRAVGPGAMEQVLDAQGELEAFRTYQKQPAHRERSLEAQLHGFMWNRKSEYAVALVNALELERMPQPLIRVLAHV